MSDRDNRIYVIQHEHGPVKIGWAMIPAHRLSKLQIGSPYELELRKTRDVPNHKRVEKYLHMKFREYRIRGEWFDLPDEMEEIEIPEEVPPLAGPDAESGELSERVV